MNSTRARVALLADGPTGLSALEALLDNFDICVVIRNADPADPVVELARKSGVSLRSGVSVSEVDSVLADCDPDIVVISSFARILPKRLLERCPAINVHYSLLPEYRGRANVNWAIINGEGSIGLTVHRVVPGLDSGPILSQSEVQVGIATTVAEIYRELNDLQRAVLPGAVTRALDFDEGLPQDDSQATYGCTRVPDDGSIDWSWSTVKIDRLIRALKDPYPPAFTFLGLQQIGVHDASPIVDAPVYAGRIPGRVVGVDRRTGCADILTGDGVLRIRELEIDGRIVRATDVLDSTKLTVGLSLTGLARRLEDLESRIAKHVELTR